jgi:hypothetical protein
VRIEPREPLRDAHVLGLLARPGAARGVDRDDHALEVGARRGRDREAGAQLPAGPPARRRELRRGRDAHAVALDLGAQRRLERRVEPAAAELDEPPAGRERRRPGAPAEALARLQQQHVAAGAAQLARGDEAGEAAAHDDHVVVHRVSPRPAAA